MSLLGRLGALAALVFTVFLVAGCGGTVIEGGKTETATLKILNSDADVEVTNLKSDSGK